VIQRKETLMSRHPSGSTASAETSKKGALDAIALLKEDHRKVEQLFEEFFANHDQETARQIFKELEIHSALEEELIYPALQEEGDSEQLATLKQGDEVLDHEEIAQEVGEDVIASAYEDHQSVKELIQRVKGLDSSKAWWNFRRW
jgi:hemerythrin superfamily protein